MSELIDKILTELDALESDVTALKAKNKDAAALIDQAIAELS